MPKKNQLDDLRRLISLPPRDMRRQVGRYLYEDQRTVLKLLFKLIRTERFGNQKKENALTLTRFILESYASGPMPDWLAEELDSIITTGNISEVDKAILLSSFEIEDLIEKVDNFEDFMDELTEASENFENFLIEQVRANPSRLYDIYKVVAEKNNAAGLLSIIDDLTGSESPEVLSFLEVLTYHTNADVSGSALRAIEMASTQDAINTLYSISRNNPSMKEEAESAYISLMHDLPLPSLDLNEEGRRHPEKDRYIDLWVSLIDGNGAMSTLIGKRFERNNYFFASILMKFSAGIKDTIILTNLTKEGYEDVKREYFSGLSYYPVEEDYLLRLVGHFLKKGQGRGSSVPVDMIILKNILGWRRFEPTEYLYEVPTYEPLKYFPRDIFQFPFETWWMHDRKIYRILRHYRKKGVLDIPDNVMVKITKTFIEYAHREIVPICELSADIVRHSSFSRRTRLIRLCLNIRDEILDPPEDIFRSRFLNFAVITTINNTLHNLSLGIESPEEAL